MAHDHKAQTPEEDVQLAQKALAEGDYQHAIYHIGSALVANPSNPEWLGVLNMVIQRSPDALALVPISGGNADFVTAATRAYIQAQRGNYKDALSLLINVIQTRPDVAYVNWVIWWLGQPNVIHHLELNFVMGTVVAGLLKMVTNCPVGMSQEDPRFHNAQGVAHVFHQLRQAHSDQAFMWTASSMVGRRIGTAEDALQMAQTAHSMEPSWRSCIGIANILRDLKRWDEAVAMYRESLQHDPEDVSSLLEMGDMYLDLERWQDAAGVYEEALAKQADHPWAKPSAAYARYRMSGDESLKQSLIAMAREGSNRAGELCDILDPPRPYDTYLPRGGDATCNALRATFEEMYNNPAEYHGSTYELKLTHLESPSVLAAFQLQMHMWGPQVTIKLEVENIQQPDPRVPKAQVEFQLWAYDGVMPRANLGAPNMNVARALFELAETDFSLEAWEPHAARIAQQVGPGALNDLLGAMCNPPKPPSSDWRVLVWVQRVQVAAALVIAHIDSGWQGSLRQRALYGIAYGPVDWTVDAAIIALGSIARRVPEARNDILQVFAWLRTQIPAEGFTCYEYPLAATWLNVGGHDPQTEAMLKEWIQAILDGKTGSSSVLHSHIEPPKFDMDAEVARAQEAQQQLASGQGGDPDPVVFPGTPVARLSDYVNLMKAMQGGNMQGALNDLGLDMGSYSQVMMQWGQALQADPTLNAKMAKMMGA